MYKLKIEARTRRGLEQAVMWLHGITTLPVDSSKAKIPPYLEEMGVEIKITHEEDKAAVPLSTRPVKKRTLVG